MPHRFPRSSGWLPVLAAGLACLALAAAWAPAATAGPARQATGEPGLRVEIYQDTTVRAGPHTYYDRVGVLLPGQTSPILGRSPDNAWIQIEYLGGPNNTGWVLREFVRVVGDFLAVPTVMPPPTPTLPPTPTAEFLGTPDEATPDPNAGRPPTYTAPAPEIRPTLLPVQGAGTPPAFPPALLIIALLVLGSFGSLLSLLRARR
jgi:hypothetical protein